MGPVYTLSHCAVPISVIQNIEKAARTFLWCGHNNIGMHYVAWTKVCTPKALGGLGVHALQQWRPALLARHAFRFLSNDHYLLKDCLVARYGPMLGGNRFKRADSTTWKLFCGGYEALAKHIAWEVARGDRISCYTDLWINGRSLHMWPTFLNCTADWPATVAGLLQANGHWDRERLMQLCGPSLAAYIERVPIRGADTVDTAELAVQFSGQSVSSFIYRRAWNDEQWEFSWIWKLQLCPNVALFWWRLCNDAIPTNGWMGRRGLLLDALCTWGCNELEDTPHILFKCKFLKEVWQVLASWGFPSICAVSMQHVFDWLKSCATSRRANAAGSFFCSIVYQNWMNRLAKTHGRSCLSPRAAAALFLGNSSCGRRSPIRFWDTTAGYGDFNPACWCPPPYGWLKANFDGALHPNGTGGCALVVRNHLGSLVVAVGAPIRHWDCSRVELQGFLLIVNMLRQGLLEADGIIIEGDSVNVINHIRSMHQTLLRSGPSSEANNFSFLLNLPNVIFLHTFREYNVCADFAAHFAMNCAFQWGDTSLAPAAFCTLLNQEKVFVPSMI